MPTEILDVTKRFMREPIRILVKKEELTLEGILSKRKLRLCATPSLPSCMLMSVGPEECLEVCPTWEAWAVWEVALELLLVPEVLDLPSRKLTKSLSTVSVKLTHKYQM